jgi:hypothetical protein
MRCPKLHMGGVMLGMGDLGLGSAGQFTRRQPGDEMCFALAAHQGRQKAIEARPQSIGRRRKQSLKLLLHRGVAFAGRRLQAGSVDNSKPSVSIVD